jgi:hypothetical protein
MWAARNTSGLAPNRWVLARNGLSLGCVGGDLEAGHREMDGDDQDPGRLSTAACRLLIGSELRRTMSAAVGSKPASASEAVAANPLLIVSATSERLSAGHRRLHRRLL